MASETTIARVKAGQFVRLPQETVFLRVARIERNRFETDLMDDEGFTIIIGGHATRCDVSDTDPVYGPPRRSGHLED